MSRPAAFSRSLLLRSFWPLVLVLVLVVLVALLWVKVREASAQSLPTLVSNTGQADGGVGGFHLDHAQAFTTGTNKWGYRLKEVDVRFDQRNPLTDITLHVRVTNGDGTAPRMSLGQLTTTQFAQGNGSPHTITFTAPGDGIKLDPGETYFLVLDATRNQSSTHLQNTASDAEDAGGASGFRIADTSLYRDWNEPNDRNGLPINWTSFDESKKIAIRGEAIPDPTVLVSNMRQRDGGETDFTYDVAQAFTTGGDSQGYLLSGAEVQFAYGGSRTDVTVTVNRASGARPGASVGTLTTSFFDVGDHDRTVPFTAPGGGIVLDPNTTYFLVFDSTTEQASASLRNTPSDREDRGAASGFSIANTSLQRPWNSTGGWTTFGGSKKILIRGTARPAPKAGPDGSYVVPHDWPLLPAGLEPGDRFRLIFLTSGTRHATATDIDAYNAFVQNAAGAGHAAIGPYREGFRVVGSTAAVDARDNTWMWDAGASGWRDADSSIPVWWLGGNKVADDYADFYDGTWDDRRNPRDETGGRHAKANQPIVIFTGSTDAGVKHAAFPLGGSTIMTGRAGATSVGTPLWAPSRFGFSRTGSYLYYGLSPVFMVQTESPRWQPIALTVDPAAVEEGDAGYRTVAVRVTNTRAASSGGGVWFKDHVSYRLCFGGTATADLGADPGRREGDGDYKVMSHIADRTQAIEWHDGNCTDKANYDGPRGIARKLGVGHFLGPGESHTWHVRIWGDDDPEAALETIEVSLDARTRADNWDITWFANFNRKDLLSAQVTVIDDDALAADLPRVSISGGAGVTEGGSAAFTLTASPAPAAEIAVEVNVSGGYAASGEAGQRSVTIGTSGTATFRVATSNDNVYRPGGAVAALVRRGDGYWPDAADSATVTVSDDDAPSQTPATGRPAVTLHSLVGDFVVEGETVSFVVHADRAVLKDMKVKLRLHVDLRAGSGHSEYRVIGRAPSLAKGDDDETPFEFVMIPAGESVSNVYTVPTTGDQVLNLPTDQTSTWLSRTVSARVLWDKAFITERSYDIDYTNVVAVGVIDDDHTTPCRVANIALPNFTERQAECVNDLHAAGSPRGQFGEIDPDKLSADELNNLLSEVPAPVEASVSAGGGVTEGSDAVFTVSVSPTPGSDLVVTLDVAETHGSGPDTVAIAGIQQVTIPAGQTQAIYSHATHDDDMDLGGGSVEVTVLPGSDYGVSASQGAATATITDDDATATVFLPDAALVAEVEAKADNHSNPEAAERLRKIVKGMKGEPGGYTAAECRDTAAHHGVTSTWQPWCDEIERRENWTPPAQQRTSPPPVPEISVSGGAGVTEGASAVFTITARPAPASDLTVNVDVSQQGDFGVSAGSQTVTIATSGTATLTVATIGDDTDEPDGSVTATLAAGNGYTVSSSQGSASVAVSDDDDPPPAPEQAFVPNAQLVAEVTAKADAHTNAAAAERLRRIVKAMTGDSGGYTSAECRETAAHHGVSAAWRPWCDEIERRENWQGSTPTPTPTPPTPEVSISGAAGVTEGASAVFTITASPAPASALTVNAIVSQHGDHGVTTGSRTVTIGTSGKATLTVATTGDSTDEADGSVTATIASGSGYTVSTSNGAATVTVSDDDDPAPPPAAGAITTVKEALEVATAERDRLSSVNFLLWWRAKLIVEALEGNLNYANSQEGWFHFNAAITRALSIGDTQAATNFTRLGEFFVTHFSAINDAPDSRSWPTVP